MKSFRFLISALACGFVLNFFAPLTACGGSATWSANPISNDWNTADNWTPATIPNMPTDTASFGVSKKTGISTSRDFELNGMVFNPGASVYTISIFEYTTISGAGIVNNSGVTQNINAAVSRDSGDFGVIYFTNNAASGESVNYHVKGGPLADYIGGQIWFQDHSSAGSGVFTTSGGLRSSASGSVIYFLDDSTAAHATFISNGGAAGAAHGAIHFSGSSSLAESSVVVNGPTISGGVAGVSTFDSSVPLMDVTVTTNGSPVADTGGGASYLYGGSAQGCIFTSNGGMASNAGGGYVQFFGTFDTGDSVLIANGGTDGGFGGSLYLLESSVVSGCAEVFGNGMLDISQHDAPGASVGSIKGDGVVTMGALNLTVGSNSLSTTFSGTLEGDAGSSLTKTGTGRLTLSGANTYGAGTIVTGGGLDVGNTTGSGTGSGPVAMNAGTLGGGGIIAGAVTIGTGSGPGAFLAPVGGGRAPMTLTIQSPLTFKSDATYHCVLKTRTAQADQVSALGVTINNGARFKLQTVKKRRLSFGRSFVVINNTSTSPISGTFANLADGSTINSGNNHFQASYEGGDGNDLALTVVP